MADPTKNPERVTVTMRRSRIEQVILPQLGRLPDSMPLLSAPQRGALRDVLDALREALDSPAPDPEGVAAPQWRERVEGEIDFYNDLLEAHPLEYDGGSGDRAAGVARTRIGVRDRLVALLADFDAAKETNHA